MITIKIIYFAIGSTQFKLCKIMLHSKTVKMFIDSIFLNYRLTIQSKCSSDIVLSIPVHGGDFVEALTTF